MRLLCRGVVLELVVMLFAAEIAFADQADDAYQAAQVAVCQATADVAGLSPRPWAPNYEQFRLSAIANLGLAEEFLATAGDDLAAARSWYAQYQKYTAARDYQRASAAANQYQIFWQSSIDNSREASQRASGASACVRAAWAAIGQ